MSAGERFRVARQPQEHRTVRRFAGHTSSGAQPNFARHQDNDGCLRVRALLGKVTRRGGAANTALMIFQVARDSLGARSGVSRNFGAAERTGNHGSGHEVIRSVTPVDSALPAEMRRV